MAAKVEGEVERVQEVGGKGRGRVTAWSTCLMLWKAIATWANNFYCLEEV